MHAEIVAIGDEITSGQLLDTNTQWLSQRLGELGIRVLYHTTVGDDLKANIGVFRQAISRADVVVATGGLGPTADDLTRESLAGATGRKLALDRKSLDEIRQMYTRHKRKMPERNEQQAMFPVGSQVIPNPNGTAPGIAMEVPREGAEPCNLYALPGVPAEMKEMWYGTVAGSIRKAGGGQGVIRHRRVHCFGRGESQVEAMLPDIVRRGRKPLVGITASKHTITLRITAEGATEEECYAAIEPTVATIRECLGDLVFGEDDDQLQTVVVRQLRQHTKTLATAEGGTGGLVADWLGGVDGAEGYYLGGLIAVGDEAVRRSLDVPETLIAKHSTVSSEAAAAMAVGCRRRFRSDYGLAVSSFPTPDPEAAEPKPVFFALATPDGVKLKQVPFAGHPALLKIYAAKHMLDLLRLTMLEKGARG